VERRLEALRLIEETEFGLQPRTGDAGSISISNETET